MFHASCLRVQAHRTSPPPHHSTLRLIESKAVRVVLEPRYCVKPPPDKSACSPHYCNFATIPCRPNEDYFLGKQRRHCHRGSAGDSRSTPGHKLRCQCKQHHHQIYLARCIESAIGALLIARCCATADGRTIHITIAAVIDIKIERCIAHEHTLSLWVLLITPICLAEPIVRSTVEQFHTPELAASPVNNDHVPPPSAE